MNAATIDGKGMTYDTIYDNHLLDHPLPIPVYARRATFDKATQHLYPTDKNGVSYDLEAPYAHSLSTGVRYWTRDDALFDIRWNALAMPPCLNCLVCDNRSLARRCDRYRRQEITRGTTRCCSHCEQSCQAQSCVELIELSTVHLFESLPAATTPEVIRVVQTLRPHSRQYNGVRDLGIWGRTAHEQRAKGLVGWRPINLAFGDVAGKAAVVAEYMAKGDSMQFALEPMTCIARDEENDEAFSPDSQSSCAWRLKHARMVVQVWDMVDERMSEVSTDQDSIFDTSDTSTQSTATSIDEEEHSMPWDSGQSSCSQ